VRLRRFFAEKAFGDLDGPLMRVTALDTPVPYSPHQKFFASQKILFEAAKYGTGVSQRRNAQSTAHPDRRTPSRKESPQSHPRFHPFSCLRVQPTFIRLLHRLQNRLFIQGRQGPQVNHFRVDALSPVRPAASRDCGIMAA